MKLYTEEQVNKIALQVKDNGYWNNLEISPIELPSDEEIEEMANRYAASKKQLKHLSNREFDLSKNDFIKASKWMKEQIFNKNK